MKKLSFLLVAFSIILAFSSCEDEVKTTDVVLNFKSTFGQEPLLMFESAYDYEENMQLKFQLFHFYISDVALIKGGNVEKLIDVDLVSFKDVQSEEAAEEGVSIRIPDVPIGNYDGIQLLIGLTPELNATQPGDYEAGHPLSDNYWSWALGYIFFKIEGNGDLDGDGQFEEKLTFHIGGNELARPKSFNQKLVLEQGVDTELSFAVDLDKVIRNQGTFLDFRSTPQDHTNDMDLARYLSDNLGEAFIMKSE